MAQPVVAVVGAGVVGCSIAYHLARASAGAVRTLLIDPHTLGSGATARSAGCVLGGSDVPAKCRMVAQTMADIGALGEGLGFRRTGCLRLATDDAELASLERTAEVTAATLGRADAAQTLGREEAAARVGWLECGDGLAAGGLWVADDGVIDPVVLAGAYLRAARAHGSVETVPCTASRLLLSSGAAPRVTGVEGMEGGQTREIGADHTVNAAGAWAGLLLEGLGSLPGLPMAPTRSHYWISGQQPEIFGAGGAPEPVVIIPGARAYTRPDGQHGCLLGLQEPASPHYDARALPTDPQR